MQVQTLKPADRKAAAKYLVSYWKSRGMHQYMLRWAMNYLKKGHRFEITEDRFFVAKNRKNILGTIALVKCAGDVAEIRDEVWEKDSIGSALLAYLIKYAKKKKIRKIYSLAVRGKVTFYHQHGFKKEGLLKDHFKRGEDLTIMSRFL